jgi:hypothetical protein
MTNVTASETRSAKGDLESIVGMRRTRTFESNSNESASVSASFGIDSDDLATASDATVRARNFVGPHIVWRGSISHFVEPLSNASKAPPDFTDSAQRQFRVDDARRRPAPHFRITMIAPEP